MLYGGLWLGRLGAVTRVPLASLRAKVTFAGNWPTNARPVIELVNPVFVIFFFGYITVIVFALIRVISALFLKDTLDAAQSDADLAVVERKERRNQYVAKLRALFTTIDNRNTGMITEKQLKQVLDHPNIHAYLETLGLDVKEGVALFHILDDGAPRLLSIRCAKAEDGQVTLQEFINGIMHCKGEARAIDQVIMQAELRQLARRVDKLCTSMGCRSISLREPSPKAAHLGTFRLSLSNMSLK